MYIIKNNIENEIIIKNSKFITILIRLDDIKQIDNYLKEIKTKYPKATHYCYGYIINDLKKSSDDGEPGGTAGSPILNVLEKEELTNILAVVVRYFGGIKLGAGGLVRAYSKSIKEALNKSNLVELEKGKQIEIETSYQKQKELDYILKTSKIIKKEFTTNIKYLIEVNNNTYEKLINFNPTIIKDINIEKTDI